MTAQTTKRLLDAMEEIVAEATAAIAGEAVPPAYRGRPDDVPLGVRSVAHMKLAMIRETAREAIAAAGKAAPAPEANGALFTASAELLAALKKTRECLQGWMEIADDEDSRTYDAEALDAADAAIAKAEGRPPRARQSPPQNRESHCQAILGPLVPFWRR